jgi:hypothetical protein
VFVTPPEILPPLGRFDMAELAIVLMLLLQIDAVCAILLGVVHMIVPAVPIVVPFVTLVSGRHRDRGNECGAQ